MEFFDPSFFYHIHTVDFPSELIYFPELDSTNDWLSLHSSKFSKPVICLADSQTKGRGTWGRNWNSDPGQNLTFSLLLTDIEPLNPHFVTLCAMETWCELLKTYGLSTVALKWPNDLVANDRKIGGVLTEAFSRENRSFFVCGMGININQTSFDATLASAATSLVIETGRVTSRELLLSIWCKAFKHNLTRWMNDSAKALEEISTRFVHFNKQVQLTNRTERGIFKCLSRNGLPQIEIQGSLLEIADTSVRYRHV